MNASAPWIGAMSQRASNASALREAVWGMISELFLAAPGVDYIAYAKEYLGRFEAVHADYVTRYGA